MNIVMDYRDSKDNALAISKANEFINTAKASAQKKGLFLPFLLGNDAGVTDGVLQGYGAQSVQYIKKIAAKYDPSGVMQRLQNAGFLISRI